LQNRASISIFATQSNGMRKKLMTCLLIVCYASATAQDTASSDKSYGKASLNFINNSVYNGRKDSLNTPYLTPALGYYDKSGFYIEGSASYLLRSGSGRFDLFTIGTGYEFSLGDFEGQVTAEKYFYNKSSTNVAAELKGDVSASASYDFGFIRTWLQPGIGFSSKNDYWLSWGVDHSFNPDDKWEIVPSFSLNAETRNYYTSYFGNRRFRPKKAPNAPTVTAFMPDASKLKIMDYEFSVPISYSVKSFTFGFTPNYAIPQNPAVVILTIKPPVAPAFTKTVTEKTENSFYFSFDIDFRF
jgi:outer membrane scaffolding protein for murein synthesis (MipA/OmpV family)